jgi:nitrite reductase (NADH) small subunit
MRDGTEIWVSVGEETDIPLQGARIVRSPVGDVAVFRTAPGCVFATENRCPHKGGPLSEGIVHGESVTCPLHGWVINLRTGLAEGADSGCVPTVPARVEDGKVLLDIAKLGAREAA